MSPDDLPDGEPGDDEQPPDDHEFRVIGWCALLVLFLVQVSGLYSSSAGEAEGMLPGIDKVGHLLIFLAPAFLATWMRLPAVVVLLVVHALISEPLQGMVAVGRDPDVMDLVFDIIGIVGGVALGRRWLDHRQRRRGS